MNNPRPSGVTLVGFLGAVGALVALFTAQRDFSDFNSIRWIEANPAQARAEQFYCYLDAGINLFACYFMLQGRNWSRWLYLAWNGSRLFLAVALSLSASAQESIAFLRFNIGMIATLIILIIAPFLLFRAAGQEYFLNAQRPWWREQPRAR